VETNRVALGTGGGALAGRLWRRFQEGQRLIRCVAFCLTGMLTIAGVASVSLTITLGQFAGLSLATLAFHAYAFLLNDLIDLPLDRLNPNRAHYPLVRGAVTTREAWALCLAQPPLAFALTAWLGAGPLANAALGAAFALLTVYNLWNKSNPFPPLTDLLQGLGWGALSVYGAVVAAGRPGPLTWWLVATIAAAVTVMNGTHGALRDLGGDMAGKGFTTAMLFGARPGGDGLLMIPRGLKLYMLALMLLVAGLFAYPLLTNMFGLAPASWWAVAALLAALQGVALWTTYLLARQRSGHSLELLGYAYWHATLACFPLPFLFIAEWPLRLALLGVFLGPLLIFEWTYVFIKRWVAHLLRKA
jgi:4-hydroxybenzoate polyprenyltransferase